MQVDMSQTPDGRAARVRELLADGPFGYTRHWSRKILSTDRVLAIAEAANAHWLIDAIASGQIYPNVRAEPFQVWTLNRDGRRWVLLGVDRNGRDLDRQIFIGCEFPLPEGIQLHLETGEDGPVLMLPGER